MISGLLDINIALDVFLAREPWLAESAAVVASNYRRELFGHLSAASLTTIFYIVRRNAGVPKAHEVVAACLASFEIVPVHRSTLTLATSQPGADFEDNLQIACAVEGKLDAIITRDRRGFAASPVPAITPAEFLARIASAQSPERPNDPARSE